MLESENALAVLYYGIAVALVSISLTIFNYVGEKEKEVEEKIHSKKSKENAKRAEDVK